ncbi:hypothetical protein [Nocardia flavorosea]|uniref:hypothetical protein n=1 Tax=Nocardia flavorosea TaxID=53429 RepID=UPI0024562A1C|nr:hypothetical protein [Nocardia flavorosea]
MAAKWERWGWKVFDAITGELLRDNAVFGDTEEDGESLVLSGRERRPGMVLYEREGTLARYDARTNELLWSTQPLLPGCLRGPLSTAATSTTVIVVAGCPGETNTVRILALDARTGAVTATRDVAHGIDYDLLDHADVQLVDDDAVVEWLAGEHHRHLVIGAPGDLTTAAELDGTPITADPHSAEIFGGSSVIDTISGALRSTYPSAHPPVK